jgi:hypothetical protein
MKAPLIAVISVGVAAALPAVAISASTPVTDPHQPPGPVSFDQKGKTDEAHVKLVNRYLRLRKQANRLIASRDHRKVRPVRDAAQLSWSDHTLHREVRRLRALIDRVRWEIPFRRAGITPAVRAHLERIANCESHSNPRAIGGGGTFRGKYQFMYSTWASVGGKGDPARAPEREQDLRAALLLKRSGSSPWPVCG